MGVQRYFVYVFIEFDVETVVRESYTVWLSGNPLTYQR